jgi:hypothetical protein
MSHLNTLVAGRWFTQTPPHRIAQPHPARSEFGDHPELADLRGGALPGASQRGALARAFAQHFHEPSLGEQPLN